VEDGGVGPTALWGQVAARPILRPTAMGQQYELKLMDDPEVLPQGKRPQTLPIGHPLATIIDIEPESIAPPSSHSARHPARPSKAKPAFLPPDATSEDAFRLTLTQCKWHIAANIPAVVEGREMEGMHQLRVGFRRLRVALSSFGGEFRTPSLQALRVRAKKISARLAAARDLDVFLGELFEPAATANGSADAFAVLRSRAQSQRRRAWDDAASCIMSPVFIGFMADLSDALDKRGWREGTHGGSHATKGIIAFEAPAKTLAERMLNHRLAQAKKRARHLERLSDAKRHQLRIGLKKLRYTAEFFAPLYDREGVAKFVKRLSGMQDVLGALQDVVVARTTLERLVEIDDDMSLVPHTSLSFAAGMVYGWHLECAAHTWENAVKRWKKFVKTEPFWTAPAPLE
jgi:CHAD domain-containing protein